MHWKKPSNLRLTALNMLSLLPDDFCLASTMPSALLCSCFEKAAGVAHAALRSGRLCQAIEVVSEEETVKWCSRMVEALNSAKNDDYRKSIGQAVGDIATSEEGFACFVAAGACGALVEAL